MNKKTQALVNVVREWAEANYYRWSWDIVAVEWGDEQIATAITGAKTRRGALSKAYGRMMEIDRKRSARSRPRKPISLLQFLAANGGIRRDDRMISDLRQIIGGNNMFIPPYGWLVREHKTLSTAALMGGANSPQWLDAARGAAVEAGYLTDTPWEGGESTSTISDLLDAIDSEARDGRKVYPYGEGPFEPAGEQEEFEEDEHI